MWLMAYTVEGSAFFPLDMLRYGAARPRRSEDVEVITRSLRQGGGLEGQCKVELVTYGATKSELSTYEKRWHSFGWKVVKTEQPQKWG